MKICSNTTKNLILIYIIVLLILFLIHIGILILPFLIYLDLEHPENWFDPPSNSIEQDMPLIMYYSFAFPFLVIFSMIFWGCVLRLRILLEHKVNNELKLINCHDNSLTFYYLNNKRPLTIPEEIIKNIHLNVNCFFYNNPILLRGRYGHPLIDFVQVTVIFNLEDGRKFEITRYGLENFPKNVIEKTIDYFYDFRPVTYEINGNNREIMLRCQDRIENYIKQRYKK